jgi:hypothetical protein
MHLKGVVLAAALMFVIRSAAATAGVTQIQSDPQKEFKHRPSGIVLAATAMGLPRISLAQFDDKQLDVAAEFRSADNKEITTVFIFRKVTGDVPLWFDRIQRTVEMRDTLMTPTVIVASAAFTPVGQANARGLRAVYAAGAPPWKSSGAALTITGGWYVAVRASSQTLAPEQLLARIEQAFAAIKWPKEKVTAPLAVPIADCARALQQPQTPAKPVADDSASILLNAIAPSVAREHPEEQTAAPQWCRDPRILPGVGVYRPNEANDRYLIAFQDAGRGIWVAPNAMAGLLAKSEGKDQLSYMVELIEIDRDVGFGSFDSLPGVAQALEISRTGARKYSTTTWGKGSNIEINSDAIK